MRIDSLYTHSYITQGVRVCQGLFGCITNFFCKSAIHLRQLVKKERGADPFSPLIQQSCFRLLKLLDFRARFCYDRIRWVLRRRRPIYTTYDTVKRQRFTIGGENVVFIVILSGHDHHRFHRVSHRRLGRAGAGAGKADKPLYDGAGKAQRHDRQPDPRVSDHQGQPRRAGVPANAGAG